MWQLIDGVDIREYNVGALRSLLSVVSQEPVLFDCSLRDNVVYGLETHVPMADVIAACKTANIHDFIVGLPQVACLDDLLLPSFLSLPSLPVSFIFGGGWGGGGGSEVNLCGWRGGAISLQYTKQQTLGVLGGVLFWPFLCGLEG